MTVCAVALAMAGTPISLATLAAAAPAATVDALAALGAVPGCWRNWGCSADVDGLAGVQCAPAAAAAAAPARAPPASILLLAHLRPLPLPHAPLAGLVDCTVGHSHSHSRRQLLLLLLVVGRSRPAVLATGAGRGPAVALPSASLRRGPGRLLRRCPLAPTRLVVVVNGLRRGRCAIAPSRLPLWVPSLLLWGPLPRLPLACRSLTSSIHSAASHSTASCAGPACTGPATVCATAASCSGNCLGRRPVTVVVRLLKAAVCTVAIV